MSGVEIHEDAPYDHSRVVAMVSVGGQQFPIEYEDAWKIAWFLIGQCVEHNRDGQPPQPVSATRR